MKPAAILVLVLLATPVRAEHRKYQELVMQWARTNDNLFMALHVVENKERAEANRAGIKRLTEARTKVLEDMAAPDLSPADRTALAKHLGERAGPINAAIQKEIARISLLPDALSVLEDLDVIRQAATALEDRTRFQVQALDRALKVFMVKYDGDAPTALRDLGPFLDNDTMLKDPWGREFQYDRSGKRNGGTRPDIWVVSPFGDGTTVIGNWGEKK